MGHNTLNIVCYTGGTCGDLIAAMIDCRDSIIKNNSVVHHSYRQRLKKPHSFSDNLEKDNYIHEISTQYNSIPSHDLDYHISRNHHFISITVGDLDTAAWAAMRFKQLHRLHVWEEMQRACGANSIEEYTKILIYYSNMVKTCTDRIISLESILNGDAVEELEIIIGCNLSVSSKKFYYTWLQSQKKSDSYHNP